jgi:hypothetical protein
MVGQFQMESGSAMQGSGETIPGFEPNPDASRTWLSSATRLRRCIREKIFSLDPLFLEDSWTLGVPAAIKELGAEAAGAGRIASGQSRKLR